MKVETVRVFQSGNSQAVRLPKKFRFKSNTVCIHKEDNRIILTERPSSWDGFREGLGEGLSDDFSTESVLTNDGERKELI